MLTVPAFKEESIEKVIRKSFARSPVQWRVLELLWPKLKQKILRLLCSELIYKMKSEDYSAVWVGHARSYLKARINGIKSNVNAGSDEMCSTTLLA